MFRGALYGTIGATLGLALFADMNLFVAVYFWFCVSWYAGLPLMLAAMIVQPIQKGIRSHVGGRLYPPLAILAALPFGILITVALMVLMGGREALSPNSDGLACLRVAVGGGLGLGLGCIQGIPAES